MVAFSKKNKTTTVFRFLLKLRVPIHPAVPIHPILRHVKI